MGNYRFIEGTVTSPMGFTAAGICASIKPSNKTKRDLALIYCDTPCTAAAVYTKNLVKSSAIEVTKKHLEDGIAQAVIVNSGNANTCNANGYDIANHMCLIAGETLGVKAEDVFEHEIRKGAHVRVGVFPQFEDGHFFAFAVFAQQHGFELCRLVFGEGPVQRIEVEGHGHENAVQVGEHAVLVGEPLREARKEFHDLFVVRMEDVRPVAVHIGAVLLFVVGVAADMRAPLQKQHVTALFGEPARARGARKARADNDRFHSFPPFMKLYSNACVFL